MADNLNPVTSLTPTASEDDLKFLRNDDGKVEKETEPESEEESEEPVTDDTDDDESSETEDDDNENDENEEDEGEDEETEEPVGSLVTAKDLKAKLGNDVFKKVPELKAVIYREQQYSQIFADPKEAQQSATLADSFRHLEGTLSSGTIEPLLKSLKGTEGFDFEKIAADFLPTLEKLDQPSFYKVVAVPFKKMLRAAFTEGKNKSDKNLMYSAQHLHQFIFENANLDEKADFEKAETKTNPEVEEYKKKLSELDKRDFTAFKGSVDQTWLTGIRESFFDKFDPDGTFSKWTKDKMFEQAVFELNKQMVADTRYTKAMEVLWRNAKAGGYNTELKSRIVNTALARARQILPTVRQKIRSEALAKDKQEPTKKKFKVVPKEQSSNGNKSRQNDKKELTDLEIIQGKG